MQSSYAALPVFFPLDLPLVLVVLIAEENEFAADDLHHLAAGGYRVLFSLFLLLHKIPSPKYASAFPPIADSIKQSYASFIDPLL